MDKIMWPYDDSWNISGVSYCECQYYKNHHPPHPTKIQHSNHTFNYEKHRIHKTQTHKLYFTLFCKNIFLNIVMFDN